LTRLPSVNGLVTVTDVKPVASYSAVRLAQRGYLAGESDFVFAGDSGKPRWQGMILKDYIRPSAAKAGIGNVGWHNIRHSYRAWLKRFAAPPETQKELMRHSNLKRTLEIHGIEPDVAPAHREANSGVVRALLGGDSK
jgi:integrase